MKILLVSHFGLASGLLKAAHFIAGDEDKSSYVELDNRGIESFKNRLSTVLSKFSDGEEVIVMSDIPAGSPGNTALEMLMKSNLQFQFVSGMNLAMILDILLSGDVDSAREAALSSIQKARAQDVDETEEF